MGLRRLGYCTHSPSCNTLTVPARLVGGRNVLQQNCTLYIAGAALASNMSFASVIQGVETERGGSQANLAQQLNSAWYYHVVVLQPRSNQGLVDLVKPSEHEFANSRVCVNPGLT